MRAGIEASLSRAYMRVGRVEDAVAAADRALEVAERRGLVDVVAEAFVNKGSAMSNAGRWREGAALISAAIPMAQARGDVELEVRARNNLAATINAEDFVGGAEMAAGALELARRLGIRSTADWLAGIVGYSAYLAGRDWDRGLAVVDEALADAQGNDRARLLFLRTVYMRDRGEPAEALAEEYRTVAAGVSDPELAAFDVYMTAQAAWVRGDVGEAVERYLESAGAGVQSSTGSYFDAALAAAWIGDAVGLGTATERIERTPDTGFHVDAGRAFGRAALAALEGDAASAAAGFRRVHDLLKDVAWDGARARLVAARLLPADPDAPRWVEEAAEVFDRCRATVVSGSPRRGQSQRSRRPRTTRPEPPEAAVGAGAGVASEA